MKLNLAKGLKNIVGCVGFEHKDICIHINSKFHSSSTTLNQYSDLTHATRPYVKKPENMRNSQSKLPPEITHWFGVRNQPPPAKPLWISLIWAFVGAFCGLSLLQAVFGHASYFVDRGVPQLVASYVGFSCLIPSLSCYNVIETFFPKLYQERGEPCRSLK